METRHSKSCLPLRLARFIFPSFDFRISFFAFFLLTGCGAPGEPHPPQPTVPKAIADLKARQSGDAVELIFTLPQATVGGEHLPEAPALEIFRGAAGANGSPEERSFRQVYTIPGALAGKYVREDHVYFLDPITPEEIRAHPGRTLVYRVRTRASKKRASADSNTVSVLLISVPERIAHLEARVTETAIELAWTPPDRTSAGDAMPPVGGYRLYRGELDPDSLPAFLKDGLKDISQAKWKSPLALLAPSTMERFRDVQFEFGATYLYMVRSVIAADGGTIESDDSVPALVTPRDTFPPSAPQGLVGVFLALGNPPAPQVELSWSLNTETDLAGYRVYRSEEQGTRGQLLTPELLPTPAFRDMTVGVGHLYLFTVTAVDRAGNESAPGAPAVVDVTQPSP